MTTFVLPALDGREPLGFLASIGTLRLVTDHLDASARLSFDRMTGQATFHSSDIADIDQLATMINGVVEGLGDAAVPGMPPSFPPPGAAPDGLRTSPSQLLNLVTAWREEADDPQLVMRWVRGLITDLAVDSEGRAAINPLAAPSGKQSFSTMFVKNKETLAARPSALREAFTGWRRIPGCTGEYLDHRVLMFSADAPSAREALPRGVPGATWLALMAFPMFPVTAHNGRRAAVGWQTIEGRSVMRWPLWSYETDAGGVSVLLSHPALHLRDLKTLDGGARARDRLRRQGVFAIVSARRDRSRMPGGKSDGVLVAQHVIRV